MEAEMGFGRRYDGQRSIPAARAVLGRIVCIAFRTLSPLTVARAETADIAIHIHDRQTSGLPWRGGMLPNLMHGPFMFGQPHNSAPSAILCVVRVRGEVACPGGGRGGISSPCPMAYDCTFEDVALPNDPLFGIIFVSQGMIERALLIASRHSRADGAAR
jgi:hypothetical protein